MSDYKLVLEHHGILGQKWGVRRFQDTSGRLTTAGKSRYRTAKTDLEALTRDKGWKRSGYGAPFNTIERRQSRTTSGREYAVNTPRGIYGHKTSNSDYLKYMKGRKTGFEKIWNTDSRSWENDFSRPNDFRFERAMKTKYSNASNYINRGKSAFEYLTRDSGWSKDGEVKN